MEHQLGYYNGEGDVRGGDRDQRVRRSGRNELQRQAEAQRHGEEVRRHGEQRQRFVDNARSPARENLRSPADRYRTQEVRSPARSQTREPPVYADLYPDRVHQRQRSLQPDQQTFQKNDYYNQFNHYFAYAGAPGTNLDGEPRELAPDFGGREERRAPHTATTPTPAPAQGSPSKQRKYENRSTSVPREAARLATAAAHEQRQQQPTFYPYSPQK